MRDNSVSWPSGCFASRSVSDWLHSPLLQSGILGGQVAEGGEVEEKDLGPPVPGSRSLYSCPLSWGQKEPQEALGMGMTRSNLCGIGPEG